MLVNLESSKVLVLVQSVALVCAFGCGEAPDVPRGDTWDTFAAGFFASHCTHCHQGDHSGGDYNRFEDVVADSAVMRCGLAAEKLAGCDDPMPPPRSFPTGPRPPEDEIARIIDWIEAGAPR